MDASIFFNFLIWGLLTIVLLLRKTLSPLARLFLVLAFAFHAFFWWSELTASWQVLTSTKIKELFSLLIVFGKDAVGSLHWLWPISLAYLFYLASDEDSGVVIMVLTLFTALAWLLYYCSFANI